MLGGIMSLYAIIEEVKEFAVECVQKQREECLTAPDTVILMYLKSLMYERDFEIVIMHKEMMLEIFRKTAKSELDFLNDRP